MRAAYQICEDHLDLKKSLLLPDDDFIDNSILLRITEMAPTFDQTMILCRMFNVWSNCDKFLTPIYTEAGLCYTFNAMNINDILTNEWVCWCFCSLRAYPNYRVVCLMNVRFAEWSPNSKIFHPFEIHRVGARKMVTMMKPIPKHIHFGPSVREIVNHFDL